MSKVPTPHIEAKENDFAKTVLMPGDPKRAKWIAENFLHDYKLVNSVRNMLAYTGYTKDNKLVSVMGSGMGQASIRIYSHELFNFYNVEQIIRIGTCGTEDKDLDVKDIVVASLASTNSNMAQCEGIIGNLSLGSDFELTRSAVSEIEKRGINYKVGNVLASDVFYDEDNKIYKSFAKFGILAVEMESYGLYLEASRARKKALTLLTVTDHFTYNKHLTSEERLLGLTKMIEVALSLV